MALREAGAFSIIAGAAARASPLVAAALAADDIE
jgi:hypothetical protein